MDLIKSYTLFANAEKVNHKWKNGEWSSLYTLSSVVLKDEDSGECHNFIPEDNKKLTKRLAEHGYKTNGTGKGLSLMRRVNRHLKESGTVKSDWSHVVYPTESGIDVWMVDLEYRPLKKIMYGEIVLFRMTNKTKQVEIIKYNDVVREHKKYSVDGVEYYAPIERKSGGRYHSFNKKDGWKPFVWKLEMSKEENRGWKLGKLRKDATLEENTEHSNKIVDVVNHQIDEVTRLRQEIESLKAQLRVV
ncbi:TPA: hypothetical protein ACGUM0_004359 [Vibrio vulnificus]